MNRLQKINDYLKQSTANMLAKEMDRARHQRIMAQAALRLGITLEDIKRMNEQPNTATFRKT